MVFEEKNLIAVNDITNATVEGLEVEVGIIPGEEGTEVCLQFQVTQIDLMIIAKLLQRLSTYLKYEGFGEVLALGPNFFEDSKIRFLIKN